MLYLVFILCRVFQKIFPLGNFHLTLPCLLHPPLINLSCFPTPCLLATPSIPNVRVRFCHYWLKENLDMDFLVQIYLWYQLIWPHTLQLTELGLFYWHWCTKWNICLCSLHIFLVFKSKLILFQKDCCNLNGIS